MVKLLSFASRVVEVVALSQESAHATFISQNLIPKGPLGTDHLLNQMLSLDSQTTKESLVHFEEQP
jgi:hypothetical protein